MPISCVADEIIKGRLLKIRAEFEKVKMVFINVYAPPVGTEKLAFLDTLNNVIKNCSSEEYSFIAVDFNFTENTALDRNHREPRAASSSSLAKIVETSELCDIWRHCHQNQRQHTWTHSRDNSVSLARLDRFYCFKHQVNVVEGCTIFSCRNIRSFSCTGFHFYKRCANAIVHIGILMWGFCLTLFLKVLLSVSGKFSERQNLSVAHFSSGGM